jgi:pyruvate dehydrogenase E2 component (dihydrolipoamide acetyltransferase)
MKLARIMVVALACTAFLFAQEASPAASPKAEKAAKKEAVKKIMGTVVSVDAIANTIIVKVKKGEDTLSVEAGAKITQGKKEITLGDIKADESVTVTCKMVDGKKVATHIAVAPAAKVGKKKAEKAAAAEAPAAAPAAAAPAAAPAAEPAAAPAAK